MNDTFFKDKSVWSSEARILDRYGMRSAAIFYLNKNESLMRRAARVTRACLGETELPEYKGAALYPSGGWMPALAQDDPHGYGLRISFTGEYLFKNRDFENFCESISDPFEKILLQRIAQDMQAYTANPVTSRYRHGGGHWVMDHAGVLKNGLSGYKEKILEILKGSTQEETAFSGETSLSDETTLFGEAMLDTVEGLTTLADRMAEYLEAAYVETPSLELDRLIQAYRRVPANPAGTFFEAVACTQFFMGYASASEPGHLDRYLYPFYEKDRSAGRVDEREAEVLLEELIADIDLRVGSPDAWHMVLGGSDGSGAAAYNELTKIILKIMGRHRQPNTSLRVRNDMPDDLWEAVLGSLGKGIGNPALVNEEVYWKGFQKHIRISRKDFADFVFGGCSETLIEGKTYSESIGSMLNLAEILEQCVRWDMEKAADFEAFYAAFIRRAESSIDEMLVQIRLKHRYFAAYRTDPVRTLLTRDCLKKRKGYYSGGPRYHMENTPIYGFPNVLNSLYALKAIFEEKIPVSKKSLPDMLLSNYEGYEEELYAIRRLPKFGNTCDDIDAWSKDLSERIFDRLSSARFPDGRWNITPSMIGWVTFVRAGKYVGATPDGRKKGEALADSSGPMQGTDREGPTEVLLSAASISQSDAVGTCVLNLLLGRELFDTPDNRSKVKALFRTYFDLGGMHLQVNVVDRGILEDAMANPQKHGNLIVRVAGYNDYFTRQSMDIQIEILKRTQHQG